MRTILGRLAGALVALVLTSGLAVAQMKVTVAIGGGACLCYLPTVLAKQLGEYDKAGLAVELVDLKGGSDALKAVLGGSADVVSGYFRSEERRVGKECRSRGAPSAYRKKHVMQDSVLRLAQD